MRKKNAEQDFDEKFVFRLVGLLLLRIYFRRLSIADVLVVVVHVFVSTIYIFL